MRVIRCDVEPKKGTCRCKKVVQIRQVANLNHLKLAKMDITFTITAGNSG